MPLSTKWVCHFQRSFTNNNRNGKNVKLKLFFVANVHSVYGSQAWVPSNRSFAPIFIYYCVLLWSTHEAWGFSFLSFHSSTAKSLIFFRRFPLFELGRFFCAHVKHVLFIVWIRNGKNATPWVTFLMYSLLD